MSAEKDIIRNLGHLINSLNEWHEVYVQNSSDEAPYSRGLLKGYEAAMRGVDNWLGEFSAIKIKKGKVRPPKPGNKKQ